MNQAKRRPYPQGCGRKLWIVPCCRYRDPGLSGRCRWERMEQPPITSPITGRPGFAHSRPIYTTWGKTCGLCGEKQVGLGLGCGRRGPFPTLDRSSATLCAAGGDADSRHVQQIRQLSPESTQPMTTDLVNTVSKLREATGTWGGWGQTDRHDQSPRAHRVPPGADGRDCGAPGVVPGEKQEPALGSRSDSARAGVPAFRTFPPLCGVG
jgi:hypothetical protein